MRCFLMKVSEHITRRNRICKSEGDASLSDLSANLSGIAFDEINQRLKCAMP